MGTNYHWKSEPCACCGYSKHTLHICKSRVTFRGHFRREDWDRDDDTFDPTITSWAEWKEFLHTNPGVIVDSYGEEYDVYEFIRFVEDSPPEARRRQYDWVRNHQPERVSSIPGRRKDWLDADGFSFYGDYFS